MQVTDYDVFKILSDENIEQSIVVISEKNKMSKQQNCRVTPLLPWQQKPNLTPEQKASLIDVDLLSSCGPFPKYEVELPPMKIITAREKITGPGIAQTATSPVED